MEGMLPLPMAASAFAAIVTWLLNELASRVPGVADIPKKGLTTILALVFGFLVHYLFGFDFNEALAIGTASLSSVVLDGGIRSTAAGRAAKGALSGKGSAGAIRCVAWFVLAAAAASMATACATQPIRYREVQADGSWIDVKTNRVVPFGGKDTAQQGASVAVDENGRYSVQLGSKAQTDLLGTGQAVQGMYFSTLQALAAIATQNAQLTQLLIQGQASTLPAAPAPAQPEPIPQ